MSPPCLRKKRALSPPKYVIFPRKKLSVQTTNIGRQADRQLQAGKGEELHGGRHARKRKLLLTLLFDRLVIVVFVTVVFSVVA